MMNTKTKSNSRNKKRLSILLSVVLLLGMLGAQFAVADDEEQVTENQVVVEQTSEEPLVDELVTEEPVIEEEIPEAPAVEEQSAGISALSGGIGALAIGDLTVSASVAPASIQTYIDIAHGNLTPPQLTVSLPITVGANGLTNPKIVLPLDFIPDNGTSEYQYFTDPGTVGQPFFTFDPSGQPADAWILGYNVVASGSGYNNLEILLDSTKMNSGDAKTLSVLFDFNDDYLSKVPANTRMWTVHPEAVVDDAVTGSVSIATGSQVKGASTAIFSSNTSYREPTNSTYMSGPIAVRARLQNNAPYQNTFVDSNDNIVYIEVPTGSTLDTVWSNYFKDGSLLSSNHTGYTRYYRYIHAGNYIDPINSTPDWDYWQYQGNVNQNFFQRDGSFTPPAMSNGTTFNIYIGAEVKRVNTGLIKDEWSLDYTKTAEPAFNLHLPTHHGTSGNTQSIASIANGQTGKAAMYAAYTSYISPSTLKNVGSGSINNVKEVLYQTSEGSSKVNFSYIVVVGERQEASVPFTRYKAEVVMKNASTGATTRTVVAGQSPAGTGSPNFTLTLPTLDPTEHEYIDQVIVTPMGTDGTTTGVLTHHNSVGIRYLILSWPGQKWPDGTDVPDYSVVPMEWKLYYDDASGSAKEHQGDVGSNYYVNDRAVNAYATFVSSTAGAALPGTNVSYQILGYNNTIHALSDWNDPRIAVRVPKEMTLVDVGGPHTITGLTATQSAKMTSRLIGNDATYNYYEFTMAPGENFSAPRAAANTAVFSVPIQFAVASTATAKTYVAPYVAVSQGDAANFLYVPSAMNTWDNATAAKWGFLSGENYYKYGTGVSNALTVLSKGNASSLTQVKSAATGNAWASQATVPAEKNSTVQIGVTITNSGNTTLSALKLYELLPFGGDTPGSVGDVELLSVTAASGTQPTVNYTDTVYSALPKYGAHGGSTVDLQDAAFTGSYGWSTTKPATPTATYVDFGTRTLAPGASIQMILTFKIPNAIGDAVVKNQFAYSAVDNSTSSTIKLNSDLITITTRAIAISYEGNEPATAGTDVSGDIPVAQTGTQGITTNFLISPTTPTLRGHTFAYWSTVATGTGTNYAPGATIPAPASGTTLLYARWTEKSNFTVDYDMNGATSASAAPKTGVSWTDAGLLPGTDPTRVGYTFAGWNMLGGTNKVDVLATDTYKSLVSTGTESASITLQAQWLARGVAVTYHAGVGTGLNGELLSGTYDGTLASAPTTQPSEDGYDFVGWYWHTDLADAHAFTFGTPGTGTALTTAKGVSDFSPASGAGDATLDLYAKYNTIPYGITYYNVTSVGGVLGANQPTTYTVVAGESISDPTRAGYTFDGWTVTGVSSYTGDANKNVSIPAGNTGAVTLTAHWTINTGSSVWATVTFDGNGASASNVPSVIRYNTTLNAWADGTVFPTATPTRAGYTFDSWNTLANGSGAIVTSLADLEPVAANITVYAKWNFLSTDAVWRTVTFDGNGSSSTNLPADLYFNTTEATWRDGTTFPTTIPTRDGYTFNSWNTATNGSGNLVNALTDLAPVTSNKTVYAQWDFDGTQTTVWYTVAFDGNGGSGQPGDIYFNIPENDWADGTVFPVGTPVRLGHAYDGWNVAADGSGAVVNSLTDLLPITGDKTVYAKWNINKYTITFNVGTGGSFSGTATYTDVPWGTLWSTITVPTPVANGHYVFSGWNATFPAGSDTIHSNLTFTANFVRDSHTVTYYGNGNTSGTVPSTATYTHGASGVVAAGQGSLARTDYTFRGWSTSAGGSVTHAVGAGINIEDDVVLYAVWKNNPTSKPETKPTLKTYRVSYNANGATSGSVPKDAGRYESGKSVSILGNIGGLVRTGFNFIGWSNSSNVTTATYKGGERLNITANVTLYAVWESYPPTQTQTNTTTGTPDADGPDVSNPNANVPDNSGLNAGDQEKLDAQTGNIASDIANGNVPRGGFSATGAWSLFSLIIAAMAIAITIALAIGHFVRRRSVAIVFKILTCVAGVATLIAFILTSDFSQPFIWFNTGTAIVLAIFAAQLALLMAYKAKSAGATGAAATARDSQ